MVSVFVTTVLICLTGLMDDQRFARRAEAEIKTGIASVCHNVSLMFDVSEIRGAWRLILFAIF
jgi:hypothetical protein